MDNLESRGDQLLGDQALEIDRGLDQLRPFMDEREVFLTNIISPYDVDAPGDQGPVLLDTRAMRALRSYWESGKYERVRIIRRAFTKDGELLPGLASIVATPKPPAEGAA